MARRIRIGMLIDVQGVARFGKDFIDRFDARRIGQADLPMLEQSRLEFRIQPGYGDLRPGRIISEHRADPSLHVVAEALPGGAARESKRTFRPANTCPFRPVSLPTD